MYRKSDQGFTIIELMLALTYLSFVLVFVSLTLVQVMRAYNKGITIKQINQAGTTINEDMAREFRSAVTTGDVRIGNIGQGRICIGNDLYIWNPVYRDRSYQVARYRFDDGEEISFARQLVANPDDPNGPCQRASLPNYTVNRSDENYAILSSQARILSATARSSNDGRLVKLTFTVGTYDRDEDPALRASNFALVYNTPYYQRPSDEFPGCRTGNSGNFCFVTEFSTVVYLPNN